MQRPSPRRTLAAILFTDMVNSTAIAEELGDRRWKALIDRHHAIVRRELKRFGGSEGDTAGDGFFASFREPASAIACACAVVEAVRELGVELRTGIHFGECESIGKKPGGIAVVVAARIMALGAAGDVLVSSTTAELVRGAGFGFEDRGTHLLKGVEDEWRVMEVASVEAVPRAAPLDAEEARSRRAAIQPGAPGRRRLLPTLVAAALVLGVAAAVFVSRGGSATALLPGPDTIARIDPSGAAFASVIPLGQHAYPVAIASGGGKIWTANAGNKTVSEIDPSSGAKPRVFGAPSTPTGVAFEGGRLWITYGFSSDALRRVDVLDPSDSVLGPAQVDVPDGSYPIAAGGDALWIADPLGSTLTRFDTLSQSRTSVTLPPDTGPVDVRLSQSSASPIVWVVSGREPSIFRVDATHPERPVQTFSTGKDVPSALAVAPDGSVWVVSLEGDSVLALSGSGTTRVHETLGSRCDGPAGVAATADAVWVSCSASRKVVRLDPATGTVMSRLPVSGAPGPMIVDAQGAVWVTVQGS